MSVAIRTLTDHDELLGLTDDDHTGYALLAGRAGGQTLYGGTAANEDITIHGTSNATRTTSYVLLQPNGGSVGIGKTPDADASLDIYDSRADGPVIRIKRGTNSPTFLEFNRSSGGGFAGGSVGILGGAEVNLSYNMDYSDGTHLYYNSAFGALWLALNQNGAYLQYAPGGYVGGGDIWSNQGSLYNWIVDASGNQTVRGTLTAQGVGVSTIAGYLRVNGNGAATQSEIYGGLHLRSQFTVRSNNDTTAPLVIMRSYGAARPSYVEYYLGSSSTWQVGVSGSGDSYSYFLAWGAFSAGNAKLAITTTGRAGINVAAPAAQLHVDQSSSTGAVPVLTVDQADVSEEFIRFIGTSTTDATQSLVNAANMTTPGSIVGWLKIYVQDDQATNPITDGAYYVPFYAAPTA